MPPKRLPTLPPTVERDESETRVEDLRDEDLEACGTEGKLNDHKQRASDCGRAAARRAP